MNRRFDNARRYRVDLSSHIAECDANYLRLRKLLPGLVKGDIAGRTFELPMGDATPSINVEVIERSRYTSVIALTWQPIIADINRALIKVRVYHDAKSAEVIEFQKQRRFEPVNDYPNARMHQPDEKAQLNRFLGEFLSVCLRHGMASAESLVLAQ